MPEEVGDDDALNESIVVTGSQTEHSPSAALRLAVVVALVVLVIDQATKIWAVSRLETGPCTPQTCIDVAGSLRFHLHFNTGASFSTGEGLGPFIAVLALVMSGYLLWLARSSDNRLHTTFLGVITGGAIGNLVDRIFRADEGFLSGGVVDFIDFQFYPIFNIADAAIVGGVILLFASQFLLSRKGPTNARNDE